MAVDRNATAWVLHQDHRIYHVDVTTVACNATSYTPDQMGLELFGMGFVSDATGSEEETLFIGGGPEAGIGGGRSTLAFVDEVTFAVGTIGPMTGSPELTGNGAGELWGFFPDATPMAVRQIDKGSGTTVREFDVSAVDSGGFGTAQAWAFAFWGGRYYVFYQGLLDASSSIWRLTPDTGAVDNVRMNTGYRIVGAGVSTGGFMPASSRAVNSGEKPSCFRSASSRSLRSATIVVRRYFRIRLRESNIDRAVGRLRIA